MYEERKHKVVGISAANGGGFYVICDDGAVFHNTDSGEKSPWTELNPVPETPRWYDWTDGKIDLYDED